MNYEIKQSLKEPGHVGTCSFLVYPGAIVLSSSNRGGHEKGFKGMLVKKLSISWIVKKLYIN
jgi:hypothetical protein